MNENIFRSAIINAMQTQNISKRDLAIKSGVSFRMIYYFTSGERDISSDKILMLFQALNIKIDII